MIKTRYPRLKLFLAPFNGAMAAVTAQEIFPPTARAVAAVLAGAGIALWGLVNEVPRDAPEGEGH